ncbi:MAG: signal peptidase II [Candidatus Melainabacteria bacterium]|nr:signal peptidase II [Candidatus Melainabacteria bacterium]
MSVSPPNQPNNEPSNSSESATCAAWQLPPGSVQSLSQWGAFRALVRASALWMMLDQALKLWIRAHFLPGESWPLWPNILHLTYVENSGVAFSLFHHWPKEWLLVVTGVILASFWVFAWSLCKPVVEPATVGQPQVPLGASAYPGKWLVAALAMLLGGASSNFIDRLTVGRVVDFLDFVLIQYPVFNLADVLICLGVALLTWQLLQSQPRSSGFSG